MWIYKNKKLEEIPEGYVGFVYKIIDNQGSIYFGKKLFTHRKKTKLTKKAKLLPENKGKRIVVSQKDSGWQNYMGSCKPLLEHLKTLKGKEKDKVKREIIMFCQTKQDLAYREMEVLVRENVLFRSDCWNGNILSRFFKGKINENNYVL